MAQTDLMKAPMVKWEAIVDGLTREQRCDVDNKASAVSVYAARVSAYISKRVAGGTHAEAVKHQNVVANRVRKALGFSYPDNDTTF